jgi:hypothetical protein
LAFNQRAALDWQGQFQVLGHDITTLWSSADVHNQSAFEQFEAIVVANSFNDPQEALSRVTEILNNKHEGDLKPSRG